LPRVAEACHRRCRPVPVIVTGVLQIDERRSAARPPGPAALAAAPPPPSPSPAWTRRAPRPSVGLCRLGRGF
jgi:hypothetical protein